MALSTPPARRFPPAGRRAPHPTRRRGGHEEEPRGSTGVRNLRCPVWQADAVGGDPFVEAAAVVVVVDEVPARLGFDDGGGIPGASPLHLDALVDLEARSR